VDSLVVETEESGGDESGIWLSIGDLMSGLLLIFVLLFVAAVIQLQTYIEQAQERRIMIIMALQEQLSERDIKAELDAETGDISIMDSVLFDEGEAVLKTKGREFLDVFIPVYSQVIFSSPDIEEEVVRVIVEGHTSSAGTDSFNMKLSLDRANSVAGYIISDLEFPNQVDFTGKLMAAGRGEIEADQQTDAPTDRRVVFRFQFRGQTFQEWARGGAETPR